MTTRFHIGAKELRGGVAAYAKRFDLLEVSLGAAGAKAAPTMATLRKWRRAVPPSFDFCVVGGPNLVKLKAGDLFEKELAIAIDAVGALQARCLLLTTPSDVTPSAVWRDRMKALLERLPRDATHVIWEPQGVWDIGDAAVAAKKWGIVLAVDPTRDPVPAGPVSYTRLRALGETRSFGNAVLEKVVRAVGDRRDAYVVLESDGALAECKRLRTLAQAKKGSDRGGMGRVVRPRGAIVKVRDDEQE